jgi:hypothetical protein
VTWKALRALLLVALAGFYLAGAMAHAARVNTFKARGDQSGYLWDAENVYANWHGRVPPVLIGERNRMPVYAGFQALFYTPALSDDEFFVVGKKSNIYLSLVLLLGLSLILPRFLPPLPAANLLLIVAFGYFVFKAGYVQSELLFYFLFFVAFLLLLELLGRDYGTNALLWRAAAAGALAAFAHLTKAAMLPLAGIFLAVATVDALAWMRRRGSGRRLLAVVVAGITFLAVLSPYLLTNRSHFGRYFYNVNTTFYMWYDNWPQASIGTIKHGDGVGWPTMSIEEVPSASKYWRRHTVGQIAARTAAGFSDMVERSYTTYWYFNYVVLYLAFAAALLVKRREALHDLIRAYPAVAAFLGLYAVVYLFGIAFYAPVSGTGTTRFLLTHLLPLLFVLSLLFSREPFRSTEWHVAGGTIRVLHFHLLISAMLAFDIAFVIWPRLMTTYGGF